MPRVLDIIEGTTVDGPGFRTSIYFAGCGHACPECHNPQSWAFDGGREMSVEDILTVVDRERFNVTFSGGDPMYQAEALVPLARAIKERGYTLWVYTGFVYETIKDREPYASLLRYVDVLVDGPYVAALRSPDLPFRGSSNQRILKLREGIKS